MFDTTIGWRFINKLIEIQYGIDSMPETAENLAKEFNISREDQDMFALRSQQKAISAIESGRLSKEIEVIRIPQIKGMPIEINQDEHPRFDTSLDKLSKLPTPFRENGTVTAGNSSGINDGAAVLVIASEKMAKKQNLDPIARIVNVASAGVEPRIMGFGPVPATKKLINLIS